MSDCSCGSCGSSQPERIRLTRNVNASCQPIGCCAPISCHCTRADWLSGIDCCCSGGQSLTDCVVAIEQGAVGKLIAIFRDGDGVYRDPSAPKITIKDPCGNTILLSQDMSRESTGLYFFYFGTDGTTPLGRWSALVTGSLGGVAVHNEWTFCVLTVGSIPRDGYGCDGYGSDGYGDGYGCDGYGDGYGCDCTNNNCSCSSGDVGIFAGREKCGFDGTSNDASGKPGSADVPSTGGCRTNRNECGDGFWDGISYEECCVDPIGKRGQCMKDKGHAMLRVRLKDIVPSCWAFTEDELDMQLELALSDFNSVPTFTHFTWDTLTDAWLGVIVFGAQVFALFSQGLIEAGREFNITDNGINFVPPAISGYMQSTASTLLQTYVQQRDAIKANIKPNPSGVGTFRVLSVVPTLARLRHLRARQIM